MRETSRAGVQPAPPPDGGRVGQRLDRWDWAAMAGLGVLAVVLCVFQLSWRGISYSESVSIHIALRPGLREVTRDGGEMLIYYLFLKPWTVLGHTEWMVRFPSAIFAAASAPLLYLLARRLFTRWVAVASGLLLVVNASFILYGQTARGFALEMLAVVAGWLVLTVALDRRTAGWFVAWALLGVLAVAAHPVGAFFVAAQCLSVLLRAPHDVPWRKLAGGVAVAVGLLAPLALVAALKGSGQIHWIQPVSREEVRNLLLAFAPTSPGVGHDPWILGAYLLVWVAGIIVAVRTLAQGGRGRAGWSTGVPALWFAAPLALGVAVSVAVHPLLVPRYYIAALPGAALLGAVALSRLPGRGTRATALICLLALGGVVLAGSYHAGDEGWRQVSTTLVRGTHAGDGVVFAPPWDREPVEYYWDRMGRPTVPAPLAPPEAWGVGQTERQYSSRSPAATASLAKGDARIWVVVADNWLSRVSVDNARLVAKNQPGWNLAAFLRGVGGRFRVSSAQHFAAVSVFLLEPRAQPAKH